jgi:hypothetical protein
MANDKTNLAILLIVSIVLSIYLFFRTYVISLDGAFQYIPLARDFAAGLYAKVFGHGQQPLYSVLIAGLSRWVPDFETAGKLVATVFGILLILPVYFLGKRIFDRRVAFFSALLLAIHPYVRRFSADVLKESTYIFFFVLAIWFAWRTIEREKRYPYLLIPVFSALPYLVRPDGLEVLLIVFGYILFLKRFSSPQTKWIALLFVVLSSMAIFAPYLLHLKWTTGAWTLSKAKSVAGILGWERVGEDGAMWGSRLLFTFKKLHLEIKSVYHPLYLFLLAVGLWRGGKSRFQGGERFLLLFACLHYVISFLMTFNLTEWDREGEIKMAYFSGRHVLPFLAVSIFWVGKGFLTILDWLSGAGEAHGFLSRWGKEKKSAAALLVLLLILSAIVLPKTLKPQRYDRLTEKWAGAWIKSQSGEKKRVLTTLPRVAYYAEGELEYIDPARGPLSIKTPNTDLKAEYIAIREQELPDIGNWNASLKKDFVEVRRFEGKRMETIVVYRSNQP